jgi:hypothetical protein
MVDFSDLALSPPASGADAAGAATDGGEAAGDGTAVCVDVDGTDGCAGGCEPASARAAGVAAAAWAFRWGTGGDAGAAVCARPADADAPSASAVSNLRIVLNITALSPARRAFVMPVGLTNSRTIPAHDRTKDLMRASCSDVAAARLKTIVSHGLSRAILVAIETEPL